MLYTAASRSLAILETLVHTTEIGLIPDDYMMVELELPDNIQMETFPEERLSSGFRQGGSTRETRQIGDVWVESQNSIGLKVPSAITVGECNILINPNHADIKHLHIKGLQSFKDFDARLFKLKMR